MPHWTPEFGYDQFLKHKATIEAAQGSNEATTRLRAIDTALYEVLGWDKLNVEAETYCRAEGYADYVFKEGIGICLVLEAKREEITFVLPENTFPSGPVGFGLLAKECPEADKALRQALGYAASLGARYIAISNGFQWLLTLTFVESQTVSERSVLVFESLKAIEEKFRLFWDCFSPEGVTANRATGSLLESRKAPPPSKLSQRIPNYPAPANRNQMANQLSVVLGAVWEDVRSDEEGEEFLKQCYIEPSASTASIALANELLGQRLSTDERIYSAAVEPSQAAELLKTSPPEKPVVVLGQVGHGKSTFLRYLRLIKATEVLERYIQIDITESSIGKDTVTLPMVCPLP